MSSVRQTSTFSPVIFSHLKQKTKQKAESKTKTQEAKKRQTV